MKIDRRLIANFDWVILTTVLVLSLIGIMTIYSATRPLPGDPRATFYIRQLYWLFVGLAAMAAVISVDYKWINLGAYYIYGFGLLMLLAVVVTGRSGMGAQRWITLGPVSFQPSEFFKLALIVALARFMSLRTGRLGIGGVMLGFLGFVLFPLLLILKQPDLGTALVMLVIFSLMALAKGLKKKVVALVIIIAVVSVPFIGKIFWGGLKDYQKNRIVAFMKPDVDPEGIGYHITQSKVTIGSGGGFGKGFLKGTQGPLRFLPEKHTDFVFSIFAEEWGFFGSLLLLIVYFTLIQRGISTARNAKDQFGRLLSLGVTFMLALYCFVNVGMTLGLMPVVGIPLPFMSYGGTALVSNFMAAGLLINVRARRYELFF